MEKVSSYTTSQMKVLTIKDDNLAVVGHYNKYVATDEYEMYFNTKTGFELIRGIHGNDDPFVLELPSLLDIGIMGHCKNKCEFCYQGHQSEPHMEFNRFQFIIDQVHTHTNQVALGGRGDPNHHPDFKKIIEYCREKSIVPNYTTSGIDLTDEQIEISKQCGAVAVSDYGKPFTYDAIKRFLDAGIKTNIHFLFSRHSAYKAFTFLSGYNPWNDNVDLERLNAVVFLLFKMAGSGTNLHSYIPGSHQLKMFSDLVTQNKAQTKVGMDSCMVNHIKIPEKLKPFMTNCEAGRFSAYIPPHGAMIPCSFLSPVYHKLTPQNKDLIYPTWKLSEGFHLFRKILENETRRCPCGYNYKVEE